MHWAVKHSLSSCVADLGKSFQAPQPANHCMEPLSLSGLVDNPTADQRDGAPSLGKQLRAAVAAPRPPKARKTSAAMGPSANELLTCWEAGTGTRSDDSSQDEPLTALHAGVAGHARAPQAGGDCRVSLVPAQPGCVTAALSSNKVKHEHDTVLGQDITTGLAEFKRELRELQAKCERFEGLAEGAARRAKQEQQQQHQQEQQAAKQRILQLEAELRAARSQLHAAQQEAKVAAQQREKLQAECDAARQHAEELQTALADRDARLEAAAKRLREAEAPAQQLVDGALEFKEQIQGDFKFDELCRTRGFKYEDKYDYGEEKDPVIKIIKHVLCGARLGGGCIIHNCHDSWLKTDGRYYIKLNRPHGQVSANLSSRVKRGSSTAEVMAELEKAVGKLIEKCMVEGRGPIAAALTAMHAAVWPIRASQE